MVAPARPSSGASSRPEDCQTTPSCETASSVETIFLRLDTMHPAMRTADPAGDRPARRQAGVADQLFGGGEAASQLVGESATGYNPELEPYPYDLGQAKQLVEEARAAGVQVDAPITVVTRQGIYSATTSSPSTWPASSTRSA
jgi:hypothetical protein